MTFCGLCETEIYEDEVLTCETCGERCCPECIEKSEIFETVHCCNCIDEVRLEEEKQREEWRLERLSDEMDARRYFGR